MAVGSYDKLCYVTCIILVTVHFEGGISDRLMCYGNLKQQCFTCFVVLIFHRLNGVLFFFYITLYTEIFRKRK